VVIVISRDVLIVLGYFLLFMLAQQTMEVRPSIAGKTSTAFQLLSVTLVLVALVSPDMVAPPARLLVFYVTGALTTLAGLQYMYRGLAWLQRQGEAPAAAAEPPAREAPGRRRA